VEVQLRVALRAPRALITEYKTAELAVHPRSVYLLAGPARTEVAAQHPGSQGAAVLDHVSHDAAAEPARSLDPARRRPIQFQSGRGPATDAAADSERAIADHDLLAMADEAAEVTHAAAR
jgi:hypothetical protein